MTSFIRQATADTPAINFDFNAHHLSIAGESWLENVPEFWDPVLDILQEYLKSTTGSQITLDMNWIYFNSTTRLYLLRLLRTLERAAKNGNSVSVIWRANSSFTLQECREVGRSLGRNALKMKYIEEEAA